MAYFYSFTQTAKPVEIKTCYFMQYICTDSQLKNYFSVKKIMIFIEKLASLSLTNFI